MRKNNRLYYITLVFLMLLAPFTFGIDIFEFSSLDKKEDAVALARMLRCPQCQNQNLIDSNSPIAEDLRLIVYQKIEDGKTQEEVISFMTQRYGEFILYEPTFSMKNFFLWTAPFFFLCIAFGVIFIVLKQKKSLRAANTQLSQEHLQRLNELLQQKKDS